VRRLRFIVAAAISLTMSCQSSAGLPKTYPAAGQVQYKNGQPMKGGSVQFTTAEDNGLRVSGLIGEDGRFSLTTLRDRAKADGAPEGDYRVLVLPPLQDDHKGVPPIPAPGTYKVEAKDNQFQIKLDVLPR
jgi:hypothetical protein